MRVAKVNGSEVRGCVVGVGRVEEHDAARGDPPAMIFLSLVSGA